MESSNYLQNQTQNELHHEKNKKIIDRQNSIDSHQSKSKRLSFLAGCSLCLLTSAYAKNTWAKVKMPEGPPARSWCPEGIETFSFYTILW